jgi:hypothetical protein
MLSTTLEMPRASVRVAALASSGQIGEQVRLALSAVQRASSAPERRRTQRFAYPQLIEITPVDPETLEAVGEPLVVVGKQISENGLGFYHCAPLPQRYIIVSLERGFRGPVRLLLDLSWCRFTRHGWYESGGRFLRLLPEK